MGLVVLHSGHFSKVFKRLMGTPCSLKWREAGERALGGIGGLDRRRAFGRPGDDQELAEQMAFLQNSIGAVQGPFDSFLALRGLKTLALRMERHCENAATIAEAGVLNRGWMLAAAGRNRP